jgi:hypothetical protein
MSRGNKIFKDTKSVPTDIKIAVTKKLELESKASWWKRLF